MSDGLIERIGRAEKDIGRLTTDYERIWQFKARKTDLERVETKTDRLDDKKADKEDVDVIAKEMRSLRMTIIAAAITWSVASGTVVAAVMGAFK